MSFSKFYKGTLIKELFTTDIPVKWDKDAMDNGLILGIFKAPNKRSYIIELQRIEEPMTKWHKDGYLKMCEDSGSKPVKQVINALDTNTFWDITFFDSQQESQSMLSPDDNKSVKSGYDILGTGNAAFIFSAVIHGLMDITLDVPSIKVISFMAVHTSRISLYNKLVRSIGQNLGWNNQVLKAGDYAEFGDFAGATFWYLYR